MKREWGTRICIFNTMSESNQIQLFQGQQVRYLWDEEKQQYFFSVVDVIQVLTDNATPRRYWSDLKRKLKAEGSEVYEKIVQLKLPAPDGKMRLTDVATTEQLFRLIQSVPSKKAELHRGFAYRMPLTCHLSPSEPHRNLIGT